MGLVGSIINVLVHMDVVQKSLPQFMDKTLTIVVALKRRLQYKNAYQIGRVCQHCHESIEKIVFQKSV
jgi:aspartate ammonia-lyase